jgi:prolipoprotein diacylglyceryltransferase
MYPEIIIGNYIFRGEGLLTFLAALGCFVHLFFFTLPNSGYSRITFVNGFIFTFAIGMIGEVLFHYLIWDFEAFINKPEIIITQGFMQFSGNSILGGVFGGVIGLWMYCKLLKINYLHFFSCFIIVIPLWFGLGRIACFLNGDAYGVPTTSVFGVTFSEKSNSWMDEWSQHALVYLGSETPLTDIEKIFSEKYGLHLQDIPVPDSLEIYKKEGYATLADLQVFYPKNIPVNKKALYEKGLYPFPTVYPKVHPTQLYEMISLIILFFILTYISKQEWAQQRLLLIFFILYGSNRFWIEFFRSDKSPGLLGLTGAQIVCIGFVLFGIITYIYFTRKWKKTGMPEIVLK